MSSNPVVRAVDLGFGNAKFVVGHPLGGEIQCMSFPSLAPLASAAISGGGMLDHPNTVVVEAAGRHFEVGPGVGVARDNCDHRVLHSDYIRTAEYLALMRGVLHYMQVPSIDLLMVGLPMGMVVSRGRELEQLLVGNQRIAFGNDVHISEVECLAQPVGGYLSYLMTTAAPMIRSQVNLVVDIGFYSLDWLLCDGMRPITSRSGHTEGGVSALLRRMAARISQEYDVNYTDYTALDRALTRGYLNIGSEQVPIAKYAADAKPVLDKAMTALANSVGSGIDIQNIIVVGGGAKLYVPGIMARYPKHPVIVAPDPLFANVRGFQMSGEFRMQCKVA